MRIIAGKFKGRTLLAPKGLGTRPITDRVKTALFNILAPELEGAEVVDLFAGTGSIGLEAVSRGAAGCCFAEQDRQALRLLARNIESAGVADQCRIWPGDLLRGLPRRLAELPGPVHLAFVDPPYRLVDRWQWDQAVQTIFQPLADALADDGRVIFRCRRNIRLPDAFGPLSVHDVRDYGSMSLIFLDSQDA